MTQKDNQFDLDIKNLNVEDAINEALNSYLPFAHKLVAEIYRLRKEVSDIQNIETSLSPQRQLWYSHEIRNEY